MTETEVIENLLKKDILTLEEKLTVEHLMLLRTNQQQEINYLEQLLKRKGESTVVPDWLKEDVKTLALKDVRLSCAIYELYNKYAYSKSPYDDIDERLKYLDMINDRLDFIDNNTEVVNYAIK